ncbi:hypothetical protein PR048_005067 [Dryococelus australis]|uniref:Uncharacterized protein n=1 Tax=Dryococelus australis TaxID=614101 RepID=A0ABQ9I762_9NEOP|nr:hypothetical protein PR048_005067 [Dryococelus australis]
MAPKEVADNSIMKTIYNKVKVQSWGIYTYLESGRDHREKFIVNWSFEIFQVISIRQTYPRMYHIETYDGEPIRVDQINIWLIKSLKGRKICPWFDGEDSEKHTTPGLRILILKDFNTIFAAVANIRLCVKGKLLSGWKQEGIDSGIRHGLLHLFEAFPRLAVCMHISHPHATGSGSCRKHLTIAASSGSMHWLEGSKVTSAIPLCTIFSHSCTLGEDGRATCQILHKHCTSTYLVADELTLWWAGWTEGGKLQGATKDGACAVAHCGAPGIVAGTKRINERYHKRLVLLCRGWFQKCSHYREQPLHKNEEFLQKGQSRGLHVSSCSSPPPRPASNSPTPEVKSPVVKVLRRCRVELLLLFHVQPTIQLRPCAVLILQPSNSITVVDELTGASSEGLTTATYRAKWEEDWGFICRSNDDYQPATSLLLRLAVSRPHTKRDSSIRSEKDLVYPTTSHVQGHEHCHLHSAESADPHSIERRSNHSQSPTEQEGRRLGSAFGIIIKVKTFRSMIIQRPALTLHLAPPAIRPHAGDLHLDTSSVRPLLHVSKRDVVPQESPVERGGFDLHNAAVACRYSNQTIPFNLTQDDGQMRSFIVSTNMHDCPSPLPTTNLTPGAEFKPLTDCCTLNLNKWETTDSQSKATTRIMPRDEFAAVQVEIAMKLCDNIRPVVARVADIAKKDNHADMFFLVAGKSHCCLRTIRAALCWDQPLRRVALGHTEARRSATLGSSTRSEMSYISSEHWRLSAPSCLLLPEALPVGRPDARTATRGPRSTPDDSPPSRQFCYCDGTKGEAERALEAQQNELTRQLTTLPEHLNTAPSQQETALDYSFSDTREYILYQTSTRGYLRSRPLQSLQTTQPFLISIPPTEHAYTNRNEKIEHNYVNSADETKHTPQSPNINESTDVPDVPQLPPPLKHNRHIK